MSIFFESPETRLYHGDSFHVLDILLKQKERFNMIFVDPPYFLSNDGFSMHAGKRVSVNKGAWDKSKGLEADAAFTYAWLSRCREFLTEDGTLWVSGTLHNIYMVGFLLQKLSFHIVNDISWFKPNAPPHLACRAFAHSHETLLWARKHKHSRHFFDYERMKNWAHEKDLIKHEGKQMRTVWSIPLTPKSEKTYGKHPTQKPKELLKRIVLSSTREGERVLDPFCGSGTTGVICLEYGRHFTGIDNQKTFLNLARKRMKVSASPTPCVNKESVPVLSLT